MDSPYNAFAHLNSPSVAQSVASLPAYSPPSRRIGSRQRESTEHVIESSSNRVQKNAKPWAVLRVHSKGPEGGLPTFLEGEQIKGSVTLDSSMSNSRHISAVRVIVRGELSIGTQEADRVTFLELASTLWAKDSPEPRRDLHWPFSVSLPRQVITSSGTAKEIEAYPLPPTFIERNTTFVYIPTTRPDPPSLLRQLAYQERSSLLGPNADPDGWYTLPPTKVSGKLFNNRVVEVTCRLSLAKPLCYTRGSVIPLSLTLTSADSQALDLLSSRQALAVRLRRKIASKHAGTRAEIGAPWSGLWPSMEDSVDVLHSAIWWKRPGDNISSGDTSGSQLSRELEGEILLSKNLKPTFRISHFGTEYFVVMLPFTTTSFVPSTLAQRFNNGPLITVPVEIATMYPKGPRPIAHSPPEYQRPSTARPASRSNTSRSATLNGFE
ncbi:hypothetical protein D9757_002486 [Collybiopsis confluens]|uniref:Arrestin-like N-terminal domain-containing protein n=1 Tax=Collybiopsis confluens TaxID=2823264 RepID=A0A8H5MF81_9AGAR|nr:hypothetical protein D9757_002486 [Collybiopsis confluens]